MRILYVTVHLPYGTDEAFLQPEIACLRRLGHDVLLAPRSPGGPIVHRAIDDVQCEPLSLRRCLPAAISHLPAYWQAAWNIAQRSRTLQIALKNLAVLPKAAGLAKLARAWKADHIHCHWAGTTATAAMLASRWSEIPWSFTLHRWDIVENNLLADKVNSAALARFISHDGLRMASELGIPRQANMRVIHMGVDVPTGSKPAGRTVLCPARLVEVKGHRHLLEAWRAAQNRGIHAELVLAGNGPLRSDLEQRVDALGLRDSVRFWGTISHDRLLQTLASGDVAAVVLASVNAGRGNHEGIPVALMEAMSHGVPVIGTRAGGTPELVQPGTGVLVPPGDSESLASAIVGLLADPEEAQRIGDMGRRRIRQDFNIEQTTALLVEEFHRAQAAPELAAIQLAAQRAS